MAAIANEDVPARLLQRDRARIACQRCHEKKVRCNASESMPCAGCAIVKADCVLIKSQRGKYSRKRQHGHDHERSVRPVGRNHIEASRPIDNTTSSGSNHAENTLDNTLDRVRSNTAVVESQQAADSAGSNFMWSARPDLTSSSSYVNDESPEMLYAQIAERSVAANEEPIRPAGQSVFLGEAFSLTYVVHEVLAPHLSNPLHYQKRLHFPITDTNTRQSHSLLLRERKTTVAKQTELLKQQGILYKPCTEALHKLLRVYFDYFHPAYPVVDKAEFCLPVQVAQQSQLVLNAVLMVAVTLCDADTLKLEGFPNRYTARSIFYKQARALYDSDAEPDKISNILGVFLMSFWWGGPNDQKDSWHWLGIAIGMAQSSGLHRTTKTSNIDPKKSRTWKMIWWSLRIRDVLVSGSIGRPQHVCDSDCDVELPETSDMAEEFGGSSSEASQYFCHIARLCCIMNRIITSRYAAPKESETTDNRITLEDALWNFHEEIAPVLRYRGIDRQSCRGLWASMLVMAYNYATILLCRPGRSLSGEQRVEKWGNAGKALEAANQVTRTIEDILSASIVRLCQIHTIPALFNALALHVYTICTADTIDRQLAETRAQVCMLGLASIQESWPVGGWVLKLFIRIMEKLKRPPRDQYGDTNGSGSTQGKLDMVAEPQHTCPSSPTSANIPFSVGRTNETTSPDDVNATYQSAHLRTGHHQSTPVSSGNKYQTDRSNFNPSSQTFPVDPCDLVPNMFAFNDTFDRASDQDGFFEWLDVPHLQDVNLYLWPS